MREHRQIIACNGLCTMFFETKAECAEYFRTTIRTINRHLVNAQPLRQGYTLDVQLLFDDILARTNKKQTSVC